MDVSGGCTMRVAGDDRIPLTITTVFGDFTLSLCAVDYRVRVDSSGRTWTDDLAFVNDGDLNACGDVHACLRDPDAKAANVELLPLPGRIRDGGDGSFVHRMDVCLATCIGYYLGTLDVRLVPKGRGWRAETVSGIGRSGFALDGDFSTTTKNGLRLQPVGDRS